MPSIGQVVELAREQAVQRAISELSKEEQETAWRIYRACGSVRWYALGELLTFALLWLGLLWALAGDAEPGASIGYELWTVTWISLLVTGLSRFTLWLPLRRAAKRRADEICRANPKIAEIVRKAVRSAERGRF